MTEWGHRVMEWGHRATECGTCDCMQEQCHIQKMWLGGQTESFQNGGAKVYMMY